MKPTNRGRGPKRGRGPTTPKEARPDARQGKSGGERDRTPSRGPAGRGAKRPGTPERDAKGPRKGPGNRPGPNNRLNPNSRFDDRQSFAPHPPQEDENQFILAGRNAVSEALNSGKQIDKLLIKQGGVEGSLKVIVARAREKGIVIQEVTTERLQEFVPEGAHQGVVGICPAFDYAEVSDILAAAEAKGEDPFLLILDGITDPHNLGAILRTAEATGVHGVIIPKRRAVGLTAIVSKTSAGAIEYVPVARVSNLVREIEFLKSKGLWIAAVEKDGNHLFTAKLAGALALVIGSEGEGISRLVRENCDFAVSIPMVGRIGSLNASVAAAVAMYEVLRAKASVKQQD